ncbi:MAG: hypothetical protein WCI29_04810 [Actinomycetes bacterium]
MSDKTAAAPTERPVPPRAKKAAAKKASDARRAEMKKAADLRNAEKVEEEGASQGGLQARKPGDPRKQAELRQASAKSATSAVRTPSKRATTRRDGAS